MSQQIYKKIRMKTKQVRIDERFHKTLKVQSAEKGMTIKSLLEQKAGYIPEEYR